MKTRCTGECAEFRMILLCLEFPFVRAGLLKPIDAPVMDAPPLLQA